LSEFLTKGTLYTCFILKVFRLRTQSTVARLTVLMFRNMSWSSMVALCICLRNFTDTVQWKIQEYYAPDKAFKLMFSCHSSVSYLFSLLNVRRMDATEKRLIRDNGTLFGTLYTCFILKVFCLRTQSTVARLTVLMFRNMSWSSMVALCICLRHFTDTVQWKIQEYYAPDKAFKLVFSCHRSVSYLFPLLNVQRMDATEKRLIFGCTLWPASCMVKPWLTIWLTTVARISSEIMALFLALSLHPLPPPPPPPLTLTPLPFLCALHSIVLLVWLLRRVFQISKTLIYS